MPIGPAGGAAGAPGRRPPGRGLSIVLSDSSSKSSLSFTANYSLMAHNSICKDGNSPEMCTAMPPDELNWPHNSLLRSS